MKGSKIKLGRRRWWLLGALIVALIIVFGSGMWGDRRVIRGVVEKFDPSPSFSDGPIIYVVSGKSIDIGGGLRPLKPTGSVENEALAVGARVEARVRVDRFSGAGPTLYDCADCYLRKIR